MNDICPTVKIKTERGFADLNASDFDPKVHVLHDAPAAAPVDPVPVVTPPAKVVDPLADLDDNWRTLKAANLRDIATAVSDGRTPSNRAESVAMIEAALAARSSEPPKPIQPPAMPPPPATPPAAPPGA